MAVSTVAADARPSVEVELGGRRLRWSVERTCVASLVALPVLVFVVPALAGHPVVPGDDSSQNFPLRVLVGTDLRHGTLPLFNPFIWSGAPLLAGWNAGAAYPLTWLFALLPGVAAWTVGLAVTWWVAGIGCYLFLRASRLAAVPAWLGAVTFAFAGAMAAQVAHVGLVTGVSWVPVELLAVLRLTERRATAAPRTTAPGGAAVAGRSGWASWRAGWTAVLALAVALTILAGEPRAIDDAAVVVVLYAGWRLLRSGRGRGWPLVSLVAGAAIGVGLGAVQWAPGLLAVSGSQRAVRTAALFTSGSLPMRWLTLLLVPNLLGGTGSFGQPAFFATYNLTEVTGYVGILPLVAAFALLAKLRWRRRAPEWLVWHVVAVVGLVLALGGNTPAWHLLIHVPLFGGQRLQSRNVFVLDLALALLLAYWADAWLGARRRRRRAGTGHEAGALLGVVPALGAVAVAVVALAWGAGFLRWLGVTPAAAGVDGALKPWLVPSLVIGVVTVALLVAGPRLPRAVRSRLLVGVMICDLAAFSVLSVWTIGAGMGGGAPAAQAASGSRPAAPAPFSAASWVSSPGATRPVTALGLSGRFAIYDPDQIDVAGLTTIGMPDTNAAASTPSALGYSSIVDGVYAAVTGSHLATGGGQNVFSPAAAGDSTLDQLDTTLLLSLPQYLVTSPQVSGPAAGAGTGERSLAAGGRTTWYFGMPLSVTSVSVRWRGPTPTASGVRLGVLTPAGDTVWLATSVAAGSETLTASVPAVDGVGLVARAGAGGVRLDAPAVSTAGGQRYVADGQLQADVVSPHWSFAGNDGFFSVFRDTLARPGLTLQPHSGTSAAGATVRRLTGTAVTPTSAAVSSPHGVEVVRAVADIPGWTASWRADAGGPVEALPVTRSGLVQAVAVPPGRGVVTWRYVPPGLVLGAVLATAALVLLAALVAVALVGRRARSLPPTPFLAPRPAPPLRQLSRV